MVERAASDVLHRKERCAFVAARGEIADDVDVFELLPESCILVQNLAIACSLAVRPNAMILSRDRAFLLAVLVETSPVDSAHGPGTKFLFEGERANCEANVHGKPRGRRRRERSGTVRVEQ